MASGSSRAASSLVAGIPRAAPAFGTPDFAAARSLALLLRSSAIFVCRRAPPVARRGRFPGAGFADGLYRGMSFLFLRQFATSRRIEWLRWWRKMRA
jgi:hypothetical protein